MWSDRRICWLTRYSDTIEPFTDELYSDNPKPAQQRFAAYPCLIPQKAWPTWTRRAMALNTKPGFYDGKFTLTFPIYDVVFRADNPGLWMLHCHIVEHDANGMDMM